MKKHKGQLRTLDGADGKSGKRRRGRQEALLMQRNRASTLSVEIM